MTVKADEATTPTETSRRTSTDIKIDSKERLGHGDSMLPSKRFDGERESEMIQSRRSGGAV